MKKICCQVENIMRMEKNRKSNIIQTELQMRGLDNFSPESHYYITHIGNIEGYDFKIL